MPIPENLASAFAALGISAPCVEHPPLKTVADAEAHWDHLPGMAVKNLFIKDAGKQYWLVVLPAERTVDTKILASVIGSKRISFGSAEDLQAILGLAPGSVTPLGALNDTQRQVRIVLHAAMADAEAVLVHPLVNTATLILKPTDLLRFLAAYAETPTLIDLTPAFRDVA